MIYWGISYSSSLLGLIRILQNSTKVLYWILYVFRDHLSTSFLICFTVSCCFSRDSVVFFLLLLLESWFVFAVASTKVSEKFSRSNVVKYGRLHCLRSFIFANELLLILVGVMWREFRLSNGLSKDCRETSWGWRVWTVGGWRSGSACSQLTPTGTGILSPCTVSSTKCLEFIPYVSWSYFFRVFCPSQVVFIATIETILPIGSRLFSHCHSFPWVFGIPLSRSSPLRPVRYGRHCQ